MNNKIIHFSDGFSSLEINDVLSKRTEVIYYTRVISDKKEFHIVNYRKGSFKITSLVTQLFDFYKKNENLSKLIENCKIKGNDNFTIIDNIDEELINIIKKDLNKLIK